MRAEPRNEHDKEPREQHLGGIEGRLRRRDPDAGDANVLGALPVPVEESLLSTDTPQDAKAGGGVGTESGQQAYLLPLLPLARLERFDHTAEREHEQWQAQQDDEAECDGRGEQDGCDHDVRDDPAHEPCEDLERAAGP